MRITRTDGTLIGEFASVAAAVESRADLRGANLSHANLSEANLSHANLSGAYLSGAYLDGAYLGRANLSGTYLDGAYLRRANLSEAYLGGAYLRRADLSEANLSGANLHKADLSEVRWNHAVLANANGVPWHFGLGQHIAIVHEGQISIGCMTETIGWWLDHYEAVGKTQGYSAAEIAEYGAWIKFGAERLKLRDGDAKAV